MTTPITDRRDATRLKWRTLLILMVGLPLLMAVMEATRSYFGAIIGDRHMPFATTLRMSLQYWAVLAVLVPLPLYMIRRFPFGQAASRRALILHLLAALVFALMHSCGLTLLWMLTGQAEWNFLPEIIGKLSSSMVSNVVLYVAIVGTVHALRFHGEAQARELVASQLQASLTEARLTALRSQLNPHFLFNTLNAISALAVKGDREEVSQTLGTLSDLLRISLDDDLPQEIPVSQELAFLDRYLDIQRTRFGARLQVFQRVEPGTTEALVPSMILQPLVENAIVHGVAAIPGPGEVHVSTHRDHDHLVIDVHDTGPGPGSTEGRQSEGIGLTNSRARLRQLYGDEANLSLLAPTGGGTVARLRVPWRLTESP